MKNTILTIAIFIIGFSAKAQVTATYTYDNLHRLTQASYSNGMGIQYSYDALGNRSQESKTSTLSVEEVQPLNSLKVYPNPFSDKLNIQTNEDNLQFLKIIDLQGRLIKQEKVSGSSYELNLESLPQATYILEIISDKAKQSVKVIKK